MKRVFAIVLVFGFLFSNAAFADIDLSALSFDELVALKDSIDMEIWSREEWQEVTVPQGIYVIGEDIPAGHWTIRPVEGGEVYIAWGTEMYNSATVNQNIAGALVVSPSHEYYDEKSDIESIDYQFEAGQYVQIQSGKAVFTPYAGKPSLGFK